MKICIGYSSKNGEILEDYNQAKACNFCTHIKLDGLHGFVGECQKFSKEICSWDFKKTAQSCNAFDCSPAYLRQK